MVLLCALHPCPTRGIKKHFTKIQEEAHKDAKHLDATFNYFWTIQPILDFTTSGDLLMKSSYLYRYFHICIDTLHFS